MKVLITGANGQLGHDALNYLKNEDVQVIGVDRKTLDITKMQAVMNYIMECNPDVVIHCAAWTAVDMAEENKEWVYDVNVNGTTYLAKACQKVNATLVYISTDYVFDGQNVVPYNIHDEKNPINYYGQSKYLGELEVQKYLTKYFIIRISWLFGHHGNNFVKSMLRVGKERKVNVVNDQIGSPTYTYDLIHSISKMIKTNKYGVYHVTNEGTCSWYEFACEIFKQSNLSVQVHPISSVNYPTQARRPMYSVLSKRSLIENGFPLLPHWKEALKRYLGSGKS